MSEEVTTPEEVVAPPQTEVTDTAPVETPAEPEAKVDGPLSEETLEEGIEKAEEVEEKPKKSRFQERIDKLTADKHGAEREARQLREKLERLEARQRPEVDEDDYDAVEQDRIRRAFEETEKQRFSEDAELIEQQAQAARGELFRAKLDAARDRIPDLQESISSFAQLPITPDSAEIIADSPKAAEIAHYLGRNPATAYEIAEMSPAMQGRAIAQIEARVTLPAKRVSSAPPPAAKITPSSAPTAKSPSEMSADEYIAWRKADWKSKA